MKGVRGIIGEKVGHATVTHSAKTVLREGAPVSKPKRADKPGTTVTIVLPLPERRLSPNGRPSRFGKATSVKKARELAFFEARAAMKARGISGGWEKAESKDHYYWPNAARRDVRNAEHAAKSYYDGITDAGLWLDDRAEVLTHLPSEFAIDRDNPRLEITVRMIGGET
jgi:Holliday junction resolvase RusA-like endonuclease